MGAALIEMHGVNKSYRMGDTALHVLRDIDMSVEEGEFLSILGASGSGKSTLMNILGCMDVMDSGSYMLKDIPVHEADSDMLTDIRNRKIGFIFQKYQLIPQYDVLQNVMMPLLIRGMRRRQAEEEARRTIAQVGLSERLGHKPSELSGGQQQRVAIARALVTEPALLLADEPTGALDSRTGHDILELFQSLNATGRTIIQITHDAKVAAFGKRTVFLADGVLDEGMGRADSGHMS